MKISATRGSGCCLKKEVCHMHDSTVGGETREMTRHTNSPDGFLSPKPPTNVHGHEQLRNSILQHFTTNCPGHAPPPSPLRTGVLFYTTVRCSWSRIVNEQNPPTINHEFAFAPCPPPGQASPLSAAKQRLAVHIGRVGRLA